MRNVLAAIGGVAAAPIIDAIGNGWLFTILGIWTLASASVIWAMKYFGIRWREHMNRNMK
jgi:hypothetical protein